MPAKKCPKCGAAWYTDLLKCAFCGIEGVEQVLPDSVGHVMDRGKAASEPAPPPPPAPVEPPRPDVPAEKLPTPVLPAAPPPKEAPVASPTPALPAAAPSKEAPVSPTPALPAAKRPPLVAPTPAPDLPSAKVPLAFGALGLAAAALLAATAFASWPRVPSGLACLAAAILLPFAPLAWWTGLGYERRCEALGFRPAASGRNGRLLGVTVTLLLAFEGSALLLLEGLRRLGLL